jgi:hypothetical protein
MTDHHLAFSPWRLRLKELLVLIQTSVIVAHAVRRRRFSWTSPRALTDGVPIYNCSPN